MATLVLQAVGTAVGGTLGGPFGAALGSALGSAAGSYIDQQLFGSGGQVVTGPRLENAQILSSREGSAIPKLYGAGRISGEIIWSTRFEEVQTTSKQSQGGKGAPKTRVTTYAYFGNFALGLCEGEIGGIGRIWADGQEIDQTQNTIRVHKGTEDQLPDSLIEAKQGAANAPAYRGLAYVVFENFSLEAFGNRIPQISIEVFRSVGQLERHIRAVNLIPGASEFAYDTERIEESIKKTSVRRLNAHQVRAETDFLASLDELQSVCPNLEQVALVVAWFGDDLRASNATVRPKVEVASRQLKSGKPWQVGDVDRSNASLVSYVDGSPGYGGTPSDQSILNAIAELKARGLRACLNPFVLMDIAEGNALPDPYGSSQQAPYPWRGRITCDPASDQFGTVNGTFAARSQVANFVGQASASDIVQSNGGVSHGALTEWSYRRMILHYARLCELAGGVDMFLLGSEMRGLTSVRDEIDSFPFVDALITLADDIRPILGSDCTLTYGADWSEYFGHQPSDGSGDVFYNLDALWASPNIDAVGIDNYMPISDYRSHASSTEGRSSNDPAMLASQVAAGEGYDWYYATKADRRAQVRSPITDGLGKPWVYRYKDIEAWWSNPHFDRRGGVELASPSAWMPQSKPIVFTEYGCAAVHNGPAQPNVFSDPKSSESSLPHFSNGGRDDQAQAAYIGALQQHWDTEHPSFSGLTNPVSTVTGKLMVDMHRSQVWAWDARPYPEFPQRSDIWSDGANWMAGHWLNGRIGRLRISDLISELAIDAGVPDVEVSQVYGVVDGFLLAENTSARSTLEALLELYRISVSEADGQLSFRTAARDEPVLIENAEMVMGENQPQISKLRAQEQDLPIGVAVQHLDANRDYLPAETAERRNNGTTRNEFAFSMPVASTPSVLQSVAASWLQTKWVERDSIRFALPRSMIRVSVGDTFVLGDAASQPWQISKIEENIDLRISAKAVEHRENKPVVHQFSSQYVEQQDEYGSPLSVFLNVPFIRPSESENSNLIAAAAEPWPGGMAVFSSASSSGFRFRQTLQLSATIGELHRALPPTSVNSRWDRSAAVLIELYDSAVFSADKNEVFAGTNALAIRSQSKAWEILQFETATLVSPNIWRLENLLRGQAGTGLEAQLGASVGAEVVVLDQAVEPIAGTSAAYGLELQWRVGPVGGVLDGSDFTQSEFAAGTRGLQPYRPAHLRAERRLNGDVSIAWIRRDRLSFDDWALQEIPMSEASLSFKVSVENTSGDQFTVTATEQSITIDGQTISESVGNETLSISVAQCSALVGAGPTASIQLP